MTHRPHSLSSSARYAEIGLNPVCFPKVAGFSAAAVWSPLSFSAYTREGDDPSAAGSGAAGSPTGEHACGPESACSTSTDASGLPAFTKTRSPSGLAARRGSAKAGAGAALICGAACTLGVAITSSLLVPSRPPIADSADLLPAALGVRTRRLAFASAFVPGLFSSRRLFMTTAYFFARAVSVRIGP